MTSNGATPVDGPVLLLLPNMLEENQWKCYARNTVKNIESIEIETHMFQVSKWFGIGFSEDALFIHTFIHVHFNLIPTDHTNLCPDHMSIISFTFETYHLSTIYEIC